MGVLEWKNGKRGMEYFPVTEFTATDKVFKVVPPCAG